MIEREDKVEMEGGGYEGEDIRGRSRCDSKEKRERNGRYNAAWKRKRIAETKEN